MTTVSMDPRLQARRVEVMRLKGRRRLKMLVVLAVATTVALAAWWTVMKSPLLDVDDISVSGAVRTDTTAVIEVGGVELGQPLLEVDTSGAKSAIAELPWVDTVSASQSLRGDVSFSITERTAVAVVPGAAGWLLVDPNGRVLDHVASFPDDIVVVEGRAWNAEPGGWIGEGALPSLQVAALLPAGLRAKVASVRAGDSANLQLVLFGGGVVDLGDASQLEEKFLSTLTLLVRVDLHCLDRIDVRAPNVPVLTRIDGCS